MLLAWSAANADDHVDIHEYTISIDYSLSRMSVEARFASPIKSITARSSAAGKYLIDVRGCGQQPSIRMRNRRMMLPQEGIRCINYTVDLARAARHDRDYRGTADGNAIVSPSLWLWRPEITRWSEIHATFRLPRDVRVSLPWQPIDAKSDSYRLTRSPESSNALALFGNFHYAEVDVPGATLRVAMLKGDEELDPRDIFKWVGAAASDVSLAYGRFPNPSPQVIVVPTPDRRGSSAVPFGRVIRDGGETVQLFVNPDLPMSEFMGDWTATHEFSHLMLPYMSRRYRWISEGFAQYYQNVLLARSGAYPELRAWQKIAEGLERGRRSRPELSPNEAAEGGIRTGLMKVYWSGAAIALIADVQLRERSGGKESLDTVLERLQLCCLPSNRVWSGKELFRRLDSLIAEPVFMPLYRRYADTAGFPGTTELFGRLGLSVNDGVVRFRHNDDLSEVRAAITKPATASWREQLAAR